MITCHNNLQFCFNLLAKAIVIPNSKYEVQGQKILFFLLQVLCLGSCFPAWQTNLLNRSFVTQENLQGNEDPKKWLILSVLIPEVRKREKLWEDVRGQR